MIELGTPAGRFGILPHTLRLGPAVAGAVFGSRRLGILPRLLLAALPQIDEIGHGQAARRPNKAAANRG